jgi:hypothetical protein
MRSWGRFCVFMLLGTALLGVVGCAGSKSIPPPPATYSIGGTVSGLNGTGLVLQNNGGNNLTVSASGAFTFTTATAGGGAYSVTVLTQPAGQNCAVTNGSGTASANVTNVSVACIQAYTIGGPVTGLTGTGLVLQDNGGNNLTVSANATSYAFTFAGLIPDGGAPYVVTVFSDPVGQRCTVANSIGTASANVTNIQVSCSNLATATYTISGTVSGLSGTGLALEDGLGFNDDDLLTVNGNGNFTFVEPVTSGGTYSVAVLTQPSGESCSVINGSGTATANVTNVSVLCVGEWRWMGGSSTLGSSGVLSGIYGTLGVAASTNVPGGRNTLVSWTDASGNFWLFGGIGFDANGASGNLNDLWKFNPALGTNGEWTWMGGSNVVGPNDGQSGVYGTLGTAAPANVPGSRQGSVSWSDASGNLWLFGGQGDDSVGNYEYLNDLWKFNPALGTNGEWTWMGGGSTRVGAILGQSGVYGTLGTPASTNVPGSRSEGVSWSDASGNLWLFGGNGYDSTGVFGYLNDLWKFNPALGPNGEWTWMGGSSTIGSGQGQSGVYGVLGTAASTNTPGSRTAAMAWTDKSGNLWLFGGTAIDSTGTLGLMNDLWKFDPALGTTGEWTWMSGSSTAIQSGVYGTQLAAASTNVPGSRQGSMTWTDASGNFWLFGGNGIDSVGTIGLPNDLWKFDPALGTNGEWTWMGGSSTIGSGIGPSGVYGTLGTAASTNIPGGRAYGVSWIDASGNLWFFGGLGQDATGTLGFLNDLWEFQQ